MYASYCNNAGSKGHIMKKKMISQKFHNIINHFLLHYVQILRSHRGNPSMDSKGPMETIDETKVIFYLFCRHSIVIFVQFHTSL